MHLQSVTVLILLKVCYMLVVQINSDKANLGFRFPCDGPGRGGTCQSSSWDHVFLGLFWMYNSISVFHFSWKMQSDVWELFHRMVVFHTLLVETSRKVLLQLMAGYVISYGQSFTSYSIIRIIVISIWFNFLRSSLHLGI
jgi:photosystem I P700 chlorophyll a apoprotein A1